MGGGGGGEGGERGGRLGGKGDQRRCSREPSQQWQADEGSPVPGQHHQAPTDAGAGQLEREECARCPRQWGGGRSSRQPQEWPCGCTAVDARVSGADKRT